ncbi:MAG: hypothetical protein QI199_04770 [Candidatus Korarchaeota archaeon]|nr:hypothetical protein [Candidatus Korarchaeota archaeon]
MGLEAQVRKVLILLAGLLSLALLLLFQGAPIVEPRMIASHLLAYLSVVLLPHSLISELGRRIQLGGDEEGFHGGAMIGLMERSFIFLFLMSANCLLPVKDALSSLAIVVAAKALFRFNRRTMEAEWYIIGTFFSLTSGIALSWFSLYMIWGRLGC